MGEVTCGGSPHLRRSPHPIGSPTSMYTGTKTHFKAEALGYSEIAYTRQTTNVHCNTRPTFPFVYLLLFITPTPT